MVLLLLVKPKIMLKPLESHGAGAWKIEGETMRPAGSILVLFHSLAASCCSPHPLSIDGASSPKQRRSPQTAKTPRARPGMARVLADDASEESQAETKVRATSPQPTHHGDTGIQAVSHKGEGRSLPPWPLAAHALLTVQLVRKEKSHTLQKGL